MQSTMHTERATVSGQPKRTFRDYIGLTLRGMAMGASDIVPGVSGGTMAFILGIYEELIDSIRVIGQPKFLRAVVRFRIKEIFEIVNWKFLLAVAAGILLAIVTLSSGLEWMLVNQPVLLWSFFFGLVVASVFTVSKRVKRWTPPLWLALVVAAVAAYLLVGLVPAQTPETWWFLVLSGALAICAMILPGISGAFILVLLGKYQYVLSAVNNRVILILLFVAIGAGVGLVTFAQIVGWLFHRYHDMTVAALTGLMVGSLRKIWPWKVDVAWLLDDVGNRVLDSHGEVIVIKQNNVLPALQNAGDFGQLATAVALMLLGFGLILVLERVANRREATSPALTD